MSLRSPCADLTLYAVLRELQKILATWTLDFRCSRGAGVIKLCVGCLLGPRLGGRLGFRRLSAGLG